MSPIKSVLFVCLGNICRSPLAEGVFLDMLAKAGLEDEFKVDSAGTGAWHEGSPPDERSIAVAAKHGIDISSQRARQILDADFQQFDMILAMDRSNLDKLKSRLPDTGTAELRLFLQTPETEVPDPYYESSDGFEAVYQLLRRGGEQLLAELRP